jgi:hypothetical protein
MRVNYKLHKHVAKFGASVHKEGMLKEWYLDKVIWGFAVAFDEDGVNTWCHCIALSCLRRQTLACFVLLYWWHQWYARLHWFYVVTGWFLLTLWSFMVYGDIPQKIWTVALSIYVSGKNVMMPVGAMQMPLLIASCVGSQMFACFVLSCWWHEFLYAG